MIQIFEVPTLKEYSKKKKMNLHDNKQYLSCHLVIRFK